MQKLVLLLHIKKVRIEYCNLKASVKRMTGPVILIISDEEATRESLLYVLSDEGYKCFIPSDHTEAEEMLQIIPADLILMDSQMSKVNGIKWIEKIIRQRPSTKIVVITSYSEADFAYSALHSGANCFLFKPIDFDDLLKLLNSLLEKAPSSTK